jgi:hypothetical protein
MVVDGVRKGVISQILQLADASLSLDQFVAGTCRGKPPRAAARASSLQLQRLRGVQTGRTQGTATKRVKQYDPLRSDDAASDPFERNPTGRRDLRPMRRCSSSTTRTA